LKLSAGCVVAFAQCSEKRVKDYCEIVDDEHQHLLLLTAIYTKHKTLDLLPIQFSEWNVNETFDFIIRSMKSLVDTDTHTPVRKYTRGEY